MYITSQDGGAILERFRLGRVLEGTDSVISELQFEGVTVATNTNVRTSLRSTGGGNLASSGFQSSGVAIHHPTHQQDKHQEGSAGTTGGVVSSGGGGTGGGSTGGSPIGVGGYDSY